MTTISPLSLNQDTEAYHIARRFLAHEAMLLDEGRFHEWFDLLDDELDYCVPIRIATATKSEELAAEYKYRLRDTKGMIATRLRRLDSGQAYAETPPSRTVRSVSSIAIVGREGDLITVSSALSVFRQRANDMHSDIIAARRNDVLRCQGETVRLLKRNIILAETMLSTPNLAIFL